MYDKLTGLDVEDKDKVKEISSDDESSSSDIDDNNDEKDDKDENTEENPEGGAVVEDADKKEGKPKKMPVSLAGMTKE